MIELFTTTVSIQNTMFQNTNSAKIVFAGLAFLVAAFWLPGQASAQRLEAHLLRADLNNDGKISPDEMKGGVKQYFARKGYDINEAHQISDVIEKATSRNAESKVKADAEPKSELKVPKFGVDSKAKVSVATFGAAAAEPVKYSEKVVAKASRFLVRYDRNGNKFLDDVEISQMRWKNPGPSTSDKNGDGRLSLQELQGRFHDQEVAKQKPEQALPGDNPDSGQVGSLSGRQGKFSGSAVGSAKGSRDEDDDDDDEDDRRLQERRDRAKQHVNRYMASRDLDKNGVIEGDEMKKVSSKSRYDKNDDGRVTRDEVYQVMTPSNAAIKARSVRSSSNRNSSRYDKSRASKKVSSAFTKADVNKDRLVQMHEFSDTWTQKKLDEFTAKDDNGDGVISPEEW